MKIVGCAMRHKVKERTKDYVAKEQCRHYWIIGIANGPKSKGVCRYCGETREFFNSVPGLLTLKRDARPLDLPEMPDVELDEESKS